MFILHTIAYWLCHAVPSYAMLCHDMYYAMYHVLYSAIWRRKLKVRDTGICRGSADSWYYGLALSFEIRSKALTVQTIWPFNCPKKWSQEKIWYSTHDLLQDLSQSFRALLQLFTGVLQQNVKLQIYSAQQIYEKKVVSEFAICHQKWAEKAFKKSLLACWPQYFEKPCWK